MTAHQAFNLGMAVGGAAVIFGWCIGNLVCWILEQLLKRGIE